MQLSRGTVCQAVGTASAKVRRLCSVLCALGMDSCPSTSL